MQNRKLKRLYLHRNKIWGVDEGVFSGLTQLTLLNLGKNICVDEVFGTLSLNPINLGQLRFGLFKCINNYLNPQGTTTTLKPTTIQLTTTEVISTSTIRTTQKVTESSRAQIVVENKFADPTTATPETETTIDSTTEKTITKILSFVEEHNVPIIIGLITSVLSVIAVVIKICVGLKKCCADD